MSQKKDIDSLCGDLLPIGVLMGVKIIKIKICFMLCQKHPRNKSRLSGNLFLFPLRRRELRSNG